jgi:hypothetical protein
MTRPLYEIAGDIRKDFADKGKPVHPYAKPYVDAMAMLDSIHDSYFAESAESVVRYALSNLSGWRGDKAREIKAELKAMLK